MTKDRMWKRKLFSICTNSLLILLFGASQPGAEQATSVTQRGVTFYFQDNETVGTFVNGDYWVLAPVTITSITPAYSNGQNGWEVNPVGMTSGYDPTGQGFYSGSASWNSARVPSLPYTASTTQSIVKTIYSPITDSHSYNSYIATAVVLTVVTEVPANNGATVFRPPWIGTSKPLYNVEDVRLDRLPNTYALQSGAPTLATVAKQFTPVWLDFHSRSLRSKDAMYDYGPQNTPVTNNAMLRLMLNDRLTDPKWNEAFYKFTQYAIDTAHAVYNGFRKSTGHSPGYPVIAGWAATLLEGHGDMSAIKTYLANVTNFTDFSYTGESVSVLDGKSLWGQTNTEKAYWNYIRGLGGNRSNKDPYGYIDGGNDPGGGYANVNSQAYKGEVLIAKLMPAIRNAINSSRYASLENYVERWVDIGAWALPDPCAPYTAGGTYRVDYGPNGSGGCITGSGRFPTRHGSNRDGGQYKSAFVAGMWNAYKGTSPPPPSSPSSPQNLRIIQKIGE